MAAYDHASFTDFLRFEYHPFDKVDVADITTQPSADFGFVTDVTLSAATVHGVSPGSYSWIKPGDRGRVRAVCHGFVLISRRSGVSGWVPIDAVTSAARQASVYRVLGQFDPAGAAPTAAQVRMTHLVLSRSMDFDEPMGITMGWVAPPPPAPLVVAPGPVGPVKSIGLIDLQAVASSGALREHTEATWAAIDDLTNEAAEHAEWEAEAATHYTPAAPPRVVFPAEFVAPNWTTDHWDNWQLFASHAGTVRTMLEVGTWEGQSAWAWSQGHFTGGKHVHVTTCDIGVAGIGRGSLGRLRNAQRVLRTIPNVWTVFGPSAQTLPELLRSFVNSGGDGFDLIYIDGSHMCDDVIIDTEYCWQMLRVGGVMIWDDYEAPWTHSDTYEALNPTAPARGINAWARLHAGEWVEIRTDGPTAQRAIKRVAAPYNRFGTLVKPLQFAAGMSQAAANGNRTMPLTGMFEGRRYDALEMLAASSIGQVITDPLVSHSRAVGIVSALLSAPVQATGLAMRETLTALETLETGLRATENYATAGLVGTGSAITRFGIAGVEGVAAAARRFTRWLQL